MSSVPRIQPFGDRAIVVEFENLLSPEVNARARALAGRLAHVPGVIETVPTFRSVLAVIDPFVMAPDHAATVARQLVSTLPSIPTGTDRLVDVPVVYGGAGGPDLQAVADAVGLTADEVVRLHCGREYLVYMLGFAPGFPYLGTLDVRINVPRLDSPRVRVPAGSVGVADLLTGIYPFQTAGGWRLIGRTPLQMYDSRNSDPFLFQPGDRVRFMPVRTGEFRDDPTARVEPVRSGRRPVFDVIEPGLYTTVQDAGRRGYRSRGLPAAGAMDTLAYQVANAAAGNDTGVPALELTAPGPVLRAVEGTTIAIAGADLSGSVDGVPIDLSVPVAIAAGQTLRFGAPRRGVWAYVAVAGGVDVPKVLGSAATYVPGGIGGVAGRRLVAGDVLSRGEAAGERYGEVRIAVPIPDGEVTVRYVPGPQAEWFADDAPRTLNSSAYQVTVRSDRAGTRLEGPALAHRDRADILSDGMLPGAIQVPGSGQPIVIMPDGPTTGGYPKIGVVVSADLRLIAQARPGTRVRFVEMSDATR